MKFTLLIILLLLISSFYSCNSGQNEKIDKKVNDNSANTNRTTEVSNKPKSNTINYKFRVVDKIPHDEQAYTQGLFYYNGFLYESTGHRGLSSLRKIDPKTGKVSEKKNVPNRYFSEGICLVGNRIYMITWTSGKCFLYDLNTFDKIDEMEYRGQGWGLTNYNNNLLMSVGSNVLRVIDPSDFSVIKSISIVDENYNPIGYLNELELVNGDIWANVWMKDEIAIIDIGSGKVKGWLDISQLRNDYVHNPDQEVANGIAYDEKNDIVYITGKYWEYIFKLQIVQ